MLFNINMTVCVCVCVCVCVQLTLFEILLLLLLLHLLLLRTPLRSFLRKSFIDKIDKISQVAPRLWGLQRQITQSAASSSFNQCHPSSYLRWCHIERHLLSICHHTITPFQGSFCCNQPPYPGHN